MSSSFPHPETPRNPLFLSHPDDTIVAVATPWAPSSIGVMRLSGPQARMIAERLCRRPLRNWAICRCDVRDPQSGERIDDALVSYMAAPQSYTGEDVVEISTHGSIPVLAQLRDCLIREGARQAGPGEFSQRAYLNGKIDLAQAESVLSLIEARTSVGARSATSQLFGGLSEKINSLSEKLRNLLADIEASIDYPEDVEGHEDHWGDQLRTISEEINSILKFAQYGEVMRSGVTIAIVGPPNAGKSSLLNALLSQNRAIVSDIPGTTRDVLVETISIHGIPCEIMDTAGIRSHASQIEAEGIRRAYQAIEGADIVLVVLDASDKISFYINEFCGHIASKPALILANKSDLLNQEQMASMRTSLPPNGIMISVQEKRELDSVIDSLYRIIAGSSIELGGAYFLNQRQKDSTVEALGAVDTAVNKLGEKRLVESAIDLRLAIQSLDEVNGAVLSDDIIGRVFSRFCVGK